MTIGTDKSRSTGILMRYLAAGAVTLSLVYWSGSFVTSFGWGGWLVALLLIPGAALVVCLLAPAHPVPFGVAAVSCIETSIVLANAKSMIAHGYHTFWSVFWRRDFGPYLIMWCVLVLISLGVSMPISRARRRPNQAMQPTAGR